MPRILPRDMAQASRIHPLMGKLMGVCRSVEVARKELRWLEDEVLRLGKMPKTRFINRFDISSCEGFPHTTKKWQKILLQKFVDERAKGQPLQLVVGSFPPSMIPVKAMK